jgi:hypothetical protein
MIQDDHPNDKSNENKKTNINVDLIVDEIRAAINEIYGNIKRTITNSWPYKIFIFFAYLIASNIKKILIVSNAIGLLLLVYLIFTSYVESKKSTKIDENTIKFKLEDYLAKDSEFYFLEFPYFRMPLIVLPVIQSEELIATIRIQLQFEAKDKEAYDRAKILLPIVADQIYSDLFAVFSSLWIPSIEPKMETIKGYIMKSCEKVLGKDIITQIFIRQFFIDKK